MAYFHQVLRPDEVVNYHGHLHWLIYLRGLLLLVLACVVYVLAFGSGVEPNARIAFEGFAGVLAILALFSLAAAAIRRASTEVVVTNRRVIYKTGLISRRTVEMNISKIETVDVEQGILGRIFGFGTIMIRGTGATFEPLPRVAHPLALRNAILVG
jgi:uncharacterized membrane protein YdbT with pleckstrin-like domain